MKKSWIVMAALLAAGGYFYYTQHAAKTTTAEVTTAQKGKPGMKGNRPASVQAATVKQGDIDISLDALGSVNARTTTIVKTQVDGQMIQVAFREGQFVKKGDLLAQIDPRPAQNQLNQVSGQLLRDQALLTNSRLDLERYRGLLAKDSIAKQQVDAQAALVQQYSGTVKLDQAQVDNAKLQLEFTHVTAPVSGRLGLRQVDVGNMVHGSDANGIVVITQTQPISVIFSIPADRLGGVLKQLNAGNKLTVDAFDREGKNKLATGELLTVDNQIDATTGTVKLKAEFANRDNSLFPNQFVNARLKLETRHDATLLPTAAVQTGSQGTFCYVIGADQTVSIRPLLLGPVSGDLVAVEKGLTPGEQVVVDGLDKLRQGAKVMVARPAEGKNGATSSGKGGHPHGKGHSSKAPAQDGA